MATTSEPTRAVPQPAPADPASPEDATRARLPLGVRMTYGLGDLASQFVWTITGSYLAIFYTDAVGFAAGSVALLMLVARVLDAVIDPFIGAVAERTRTRWGRFRPWILFGMLPLSVLMVLSFTAPFGPSTLGFVYAVITYGVLGILYSAVNVPYGALATVMSERSADRISLNSWRMVGTNVGGIALGLIIMPMIVLFSGAGDGTTQTVQGYTLTAMVFAVAALPLFLAVVVASREVIAPRHGRSVPLRATFRAVLGNGPLMLLFPVAILSLTSMFGRIGIVIYYYIYNVGDMALVPILMALAPGMTVLGILMFAPLGRRFGKRNMLIASLLAQAASLVALFLVGFEDPALVIALTAAYGLSNFGVPLLLAMTADCIDFADDRDGVRSDGTSYALISFATKLASAVGGAVGIGLLGVLGYVANAQQSPEALAGINGAVNLFPAAAALLAIVPLLFYRLTEAKYSEIRRRLDARSAAEAADA